MSFFGLGRPEAKPTIHKEIFSLAFHSKGGFPWNDVYNMPVWLRKFYLTELIDWRNKEQEEYDKARKKSQSKPPSFKSPKR